ncbi:MAG: PAS domain-containing protein [Kiritimatiellae bacterium]|nr:PAS domain-containing protein [Kiritimatiellia bacterium]
MSMFKTIKLYSKTAMAREPLKVARKGARGGEEAREDPLYRELLDNIYDAVLVTDFEGRIVDANPRAEEFFLQRKIALRKLRIRDIVSGVTESLLGTIRQNIINRKFTLLEGHCLRKDGTTFPAEITISLIHWTKSGQLCFFVRNIARRKKAEDRLRAQNSALQNSANAVAICAMDATLTFANLAFLQLWGYGNQGEVIGRDIRLFLGEEDQLSEIIQQLRDGKPWTGEMVAARAQGEAFYVQLSAAPNRGADEKVIGMVFSFVDITERRKSEEALRKESQEMLERARSQKDFSGLLNIISISDVIQLINATRKSGRLEIRKFPFRLVSTLTFADGEIIEASCGGKTGAEAVYDTLRARGEEFNFEEGTPSRPKHPIKEKTMAMLMEGCRLLDEIPAEPEPGRIVKTILAVDDDPGVLATIRETLTRKGYNCVAISDPDECFAVLTKNSIDLVVLDVQMPGKDGYEVYREIKDFRNVPVLFVTGYASAVAPDTPSEVDFLQKEFITGQTDIIYKPFNINTLCDKVEALIGETEKA